jgi:hypothetical protein
MSALHHCQGGVSLRELMRSKRHAATHARPVLSFLHVCRGACAHSAGVGGGQGGQTVSVRTFDGLGLGVDGRTFGLRAVLEAGGAGSLVLTTKMKPVVGAKRGVDPTCDLRPCACSNTSTIIHRAWCAVPGVCAPHTHTQGCARVVLLALMRTLHAATSTGIVWLSRWCLVVLQQQRIQLRGKWWAPRSAHASQALVWSLCDAVAAFVWCGLHKEA